jgi:hypothetical protein
MLTIPTSCNVLGDIYPDLYFSVIKKNIEAGIAQYSDGLWAGWPGFDSWEGQDIFLYTMSRPTLERTQPPIQWYQGVEQPGHEADHSPPSSAEVKNGGAIPPLPIHLHKVVLY